MGNKISFKLAVAFAMVTVSFVDVAAAKPYEGGVFKGRIAWSADGNHNDPDDWIASPMALAIFAEAGLKDRLVHFDYNCILPQTNVEWEKIHAESVLGAAERYGYDRSRFIDCRKNLEQAIASIARAIDASSADNPLYFVVAGPMEVPYLGLQKSDPAKRKFVYCISHSRWNEGFSTQYKFTFTKRSVIEQGVHWVQLRNQNDLLAAGQFGRPSPPEEFSAYFWMRDARDPKIKFLWERMVVSTRPDPSDAGMAWFLATGDDECDPAKLHRLLEGQRPATLVSSRQTLRIEAENFFFHEGYALDQRNDRNASHRLSVALSGATAGRIRTRFDEPYTHARGRYDVDIRYMDEKGPRRRFTFLVNGTACGPAWEAPGKGLGWTSHTVRDVAITTGDEIRVGGEGAPARLDYVQLNLVAESVGSAVPGAASSNLASSPDSAPDNPAAMPGGSMIAGANPGHLK